MTLLMGIIIFILVLCFSSMVTLESRTVQNNNYANIAFYAADAGIQRGLVELANVENTVISNLISGTTPVVQYVDIAYLMGASSGSYTVSIFGKNCPDPDYAPQIGSFGQVSTMPDEPAPQPPAGTRGRYRWRFTMLSEGALIESGTTLARRSLIAKVLIARAEDGDDYQGYVRMEYWSELNR